jgi:hypothetical protein
MIMKKSKISMYLFIVIYVISISIKICVGQGAQINLEKYWKYRERLKNFVVVGDCMGCSEPANGRDGTNSLSYDDATSVHGYYLGMLATEHKLLCSIQNPDAATIAQINRNEIELGYALEAINRLDMMAEFAWRQSSPCYIDPRTVSNPYSIGYHGTDDLNGFFIRNDAITGADGTATSAPPSFLGPVQSSIYFTPNLPSEIYPTTYPYIVDYLNSSYAPPDDGKRALLTGLSYFNAITPNVPANNQYFFGYYNQYASEETQDQMTHLWEGLSLVIKCLPHSTNWTHTFSGSGNITSFQDEAKAIVDRMYQHVFTNYTPCDYGVICNPVSGFMTLGVDQDGHQGCATNTFPARCRGADESYIANTFYRAYFQMFYGGFDPGLGDLSSYGENLLLSLSSAQWFLATLGSISKIWGDNTPNILTGLIGNAGCEQIALVYRILYQCDNDHIIFGNNSTVTDSYFFTQMLDEPACEGRNAYNTDFTSLWDEGQGNRWMYSGDNHCYSDEFNGLDYLHLFNLYALVHPDYFTNAGINYSYMAPQQLCKYDLVKTHYNEWDTKNFLASNSITAGIYGPTGDGTTSDGPIKNPCDIPITHYGAGEYIIENTADNPDELHAGNVNFIAGVNVDLKPGFWAKNGCTFNATINPSIQAMSCYSGTSNDNSRISNNNPSNSSNKKTNLNNSIFPNPNDGNFTLSYNLLTTDGEFDIKDMTGRLIYKQKIERLLGISIINVSEISAGIYYWEIYNSKEIIDKGKIAIIRK